MNKEVENLVKNQLKCIDQMNEITEGKYTTDTAEYFAELAGVRKALAVMGIEVNFNFNPCYYLNHEPSTYTINEK